MQSPLSALCKLCSKVLHSSSVSSGGVSDGRKDPSGLNGLISIASRESQLPDRTPAYMSWKQFPHDSNQRYNCTRLMEAQSSNVRTFRRHPDSIDLSIRHVLVQHMPASRQYIYQWKVTHVLRSKPCNCS